MLAATFGNSGSTPDRGEDDYHNPKEGWQAGEVPPEKMNNFGEGPTGAEISAEGRGIGPALPFATPPSLRVI